MRPRLHAVYALLVAASFGAAQEPSGTPKPSSPVADHAAPAADHAAASPTPRAAPAETAPGGSDGGAGSVNSVKQYVLGPLDEVFIKVWGQDRLNGIYNVGPDGLLSMPLIGSVKADGLTIAQLNDLVRQRLGEYYESPDVNTELAKNNSKRFFIMGEGAAHPGEFPLNGPTTVSEALAISGGFRDFANRKKIYVLRGTKKFSFNYKDVIQGKHLDQDILLDNGDKIVIPE